MSTVYQIVTDKIMAALEQGTVPWRKPWQSLGAPRNAVTGKPYRGINVFLLGLADYGDPRWLTFRQALALGGHVRKGEKGSLIIFWQSPDAGRSEEGGDAGETEDERRAPVWRYYTVFNAEQCDGLALPAIATAPAADPIAEAEVIIAGMPNRPRIAHDGGDRAYYRPATDSVHLPPRAAFPEGAEYYSTAFHELGHSTGHASRLDRHGLETGIAPFGSETYSREELVAEFAAAFLCQRAGIQTTTANSAAYIAGWLRALKDDRRLAVIAAAQGQKAADYIMGASQTIAGEYTNVAA